MSGAVFSRCGRYRYRLERDVRADGPTVAFFGVNASTANAVREDQTTRKWTGFSRVHGFGRYLVGNPFAYCATDVRDLATERDPVGPLNAKHLEAIIADAEILVPCWGNRHKLPQHLWGHLNQLKLQLFDAKKPVLIFGLTATGDPKHPLMLPYSTPLVEWAK